MQCRTDRSQGKRLSLAFGAVTPNNAQQEYYLTDVVEIANARGLRALTLEAREDEVMGVNDRAQLAAAEAALQDRLRRRAMAEGATLVAPETVFLSFDVKIGRDVLIEPNVVIGPGATVEDGAVIHALSHLEGARIAPGASVGPFARLRPGADIAANAKVGNFVEIKAGGHRTGRQGQPFELHRRRARRRGREHRRRNHHLQLRRLFQAQDRHWGAFIGSNTPLVAPVTIGEGAYVGSGSVITKSVEADALAVARGRQEARSGWAKAFRAKQVLRTV